jgi:hypothetical protein
VCDSAAIAVTELDGASGEQVLMKRHHNLRTSSISTSDKKYMYGLSFSLIPAHLDLLQTYGVQLE